MVMHYSGEGCKIACGRNNHAITNTREVSRVRCRNCLDSQGYQQGLWFSEFQIHTGAEPKGLEEWADGTTPFEKAAQYSLACFRQETQEMVDRLENQLSTLIL